MDESKTVSEEGLIEIVKCEECGKEMEVDQTQSQDGTLFVWYKCGCEEILLKKYDDHSLNHR